MSEGTIQRITDPENKSKEEQGNENITMEEMVKAIKSLERNKAMGPDKIPNEIFLESNYDTKTLYLEILDAIHNNKYLQLNILMNFLVSHVTRQPPIKVTQRKQYKEPAPSGIR